MATNKKSKRALIGAAGLVFASLLSSGAYGIQLVHQHLIGFPDATAGPTTEGDVTTWNYYDVFPVYDDYVLASFGSFDSWNSVLDSSGNYQAGQTDNGVVQINHSGSTLNLSGLTLTGHAEEFTSDGTNSISHISLSLVLWDGSSLTTLANDLISNLSSTFTPVDLLPSGGDNFMEVDFTAEINFTSTLALNTGDKLFFQFYESAEDSNSETDNFFTSLDLNFVEDTGSVNPAPAPTPLALLSIGLLLAISARKRLVKHS